MESNEIDDVQYRLRMIKYTYDVLNIDDPIKAYQKIPLSHILELTQSWRDTMKEIFSSTVDLDEETLNDNFKLLSKVMLHHLNMSLVIEGDYVVSQSADGRDVDLPELVGKDLWFCKKLEENNQ
jgi:hypothetical protein